MLIYFLFIKAIFFQIAFTPRFPTASLPVDSTSQSKPKRGSNQEDTNDQLKNHYVALTLYSTASYTFYIVLLQTHEQNRNWYCN